MTLRLFLVASLVALTVLATHLPAYAQLVISANDGKAVLVNGVNTVPTPPGADTVTLLDASVTPPRVVAELRVPNSVIGPPQNVAIAPDGSFAVVTSSTKLDPADASKTVNDNTMTVIDLRRTPAAVAGTVTAGVMASGASFSPDGRLLLVANRGEGTVSVFTVNGLTLTAGPKVDLGAPNSGPSHVAFTPDGRMALVTRNNDHLVSVLAVNGTAVSYTKRDIVAGLKPYGIDITPDGSIALVGNTGSGTTGSVDTVAVIDLTLDTPRTVDYVTVGVIPEAVGISPDGRFAAVTVMNGTNAVPSSPIYNNFGRLRVFAIGNKTLTPVAEARIGNWCQGVMWTTRDTVLTQCMSEREIQVFRFDGKALTAAGSVKVNGAPAGMGVRR
ncbi:MAG: YncE family protein [Acidobacteria bacterium]|nr:YncE family protein [Acidobacteriota bacterium]